MKLSLHKLFRNTTFENINLNQFYLANKSQIPNVTDPTYLNYHLRHLGFNTFGGYGEDRSDVWKGTYLDDSPGFVHLGCDINIPYKTSVYIDFDFEIIDVFTDTDTKIGWGGRVIIRRTPTSPYIIFAHLDPRTLISRFNKSLCYQKIGEVGTWPTNGNTFEHLHLQLRYTNDFENMDGYGTKEDLLNNPCPFTTEI